MEYYIFSEEQRQKIFALASEKSMLFHFVDSNKGIIKGLLYISPLFLVVILGLFLSYQGYSDNIIGPSVILSTIFIAIIMGKRLLKSLSAKRN